MKVRNEASVGLTSDEGSNPRSRTQLTLLLFNQAVEMKENRCSQSSLMEQIIEPANIEQAWKRVRANKGSAGIDGMSVQWQVERGQSTISIFFNIFHSKSYF